MSKTIGVVFGGPSPEHDISILTGLQSVRILSKKYDVIALYWSKNNEWYLVDNEYESVDFLSNKKIYKNKLEMKFNDDPGFYQKTCQNLPKRNSTSRLWRSRNSFLQFLKAF